jgi:hypothetical protein
MYKDVENQFKKIAHTNYETIITFYKKTKGAGFMARNRVVVPEAKQALDQFKLEIADELGLYNYDQMDKGELTSRQNGYVGGYMVKRLIERAEREMANK